MQTGFKRFKRLTNRHVAYLEKRSKFNLSGINNEK